MPLIKTFLLSILVVGCAADPTKTFLEFAGENLPSKFIYPITQDKYIHHVPGFFIDKKEIKIDPDTSKIKYRIIYDNRAVKANYASEYQITAPNAFRHKFPAYVEKKGWVKCGTKLGEETTIVFSEEMKTINESIGQTGIEAVILCNSYEDSILSKTQK